MVSPAQLSVLLPGAVSGSFRGGDPLLLLCGALALVALVAIHRVVSARKTTRAVSRDARARAEALREFLETVRVAEKIAGIGIWQYDPCSGQQQWSGGMKRLFGIDEGEEFVAGDAETLLFAHDIDLVTRVSQHAAETQPFTLEFDLDGFGADSRAIAVQACNLMDAEGGVRRVVAVVREVDGQGRKRHDQAAGRRAPWYHGRDVITATAFCDPLTGLANRQLLMAELDRRVMDARINEMPLVLVMFEIDHFAQINASNKSDAGDRLLRMVAQLARVQARDTDLISRVGNSEFAWIVPGTSDRMARIMTERLRHAIAQGTTISDGPAATISVGYAALKPDDTALSLFARVDGALWEARSTGCNRVRMAA